MARRRARGARRDPRTIAAAALVTLAALGVLFLSARYAAEAAGRLPPPMSQLEMKLGLVNAMRPDHRITPAELAAARRAAAAAPLAYEPFYIAARAEEQARHLPQATRLMEEARRRRASYPATRLSLMGYYGLAGRYDEAIAEADVSMRLSSEAQRAILPVLAGMLPYQEARPPLARILAGNPRWRSDFIEIAKAKARPEDAADLLAQLRRLAPPSGTAPEASLLVASLMRVQRYDQAHRIWLGLVPPDERARAALVFDADFRGVPAPPPFNWTYGSSAGGRANPAKPGPGESPYMEASYFGGSRAVLAEQSLVLAPGRYRLSVRGKADRRELSGELFWQLTCLPAKNEIGRLPLASFTEQYRVYRTEFAVPAGCAAQTLALVGEPGDLAQPINAELAQLKVERVG
jgi:tetratricopeptide (TPR) repeat protein